tara:strand:- start:2503 stop:3753 length:1251 start_codon:yes stop_codon:yes gene_type:complete
MITSLIILISFAVVFAFLHVKTKSGFFKYFSWFFPIPIISTFFFYISLRIFRFFKLEQRLDEYSNKKKANNFIKNKQIHLEKAKLERQGKEMFFSEDHDLSNEQKLMAIIELAYADKVFSDEEKTYLLIKGKDLGFEEVEIKMMMDAVDSGSGDIAENKDFSISELIKDEVKKDTNCVNCGANIKPFTVNCIYCKTINNQNSYLNTYTRLKDDLEQRAVRDTEILEKNKVSSSYNAFKLSFDTKLKIKKLEYEKKIYTIFPIPKDRNNFAELLSSVASDSSPSRIRGIKREIKSLSTNVYFLPIYALVGTIGSIIVFVSIYTNGFTEINFISLFYLLPGLALLVVLLTPNNFFQKSFQKLAILTAELECTEAKRNYYRKLTTYGKSYLKSDKSIQEMIIETNTVANKGRFNPFSTE